MRWRVGPRVDVDVVVGGKLVEVLTEPGSKLIGKLQQKTYPVQEINGVVFVFIGDIDPPPAIEQDIQPKFLQPM